MNAPTRGPARDPLPDPLRVNWVWRTSQVLFQTVCVFWLDLRVRGMDRLPAGGGLILANHQSVLDPMLIGVALQRPVTFLARHTLFRVPVLGWILRRTYVMPINRDAAGTESIREAARRMQHGFLAGIFPEGTRSTEGVIGELKPGFIALVRHGKVPVIPVGIAGADAAMPRGRILPRRTNIRLIFGEPIPFTEIEPLARRGREQELIATVRDRMLACRREAVDWLAAK